MVEYVLRSCLADSLIFFYLFPYKEINKKIRLKVDGNMYLEKKEQTKKAAEIIIESWAHGEISFVECFSGTLNSRGLKRFTKEQIRVRNEILEQFQAPELDAKSLEIIASNGLIKAIRNYNDKLPLAFDTFAARYIEDEIQNYLYSIL